MKSFKDFLSEDGIDYFIILIQNDRLPSFALVNEGVWRDSMKKEWMFRVDSASPEMNQQRHVHISRKSHVSSKNQQVAWNHDGSIHDRRTFNHGISKIKAVQSIARDALGLSPNFQLEEARKAIRTLFLLNESITPDDNIPIFKALYA